MLGTAGGTITIVTFRSLRIGRRPGSIRHRLGGCSPIYRNAVCCNRRSWWRSASSAEHRALTRRPAAITGSIAAAALLIGGGVRGGQVIGESDARAERPRLRPVTPADLAASIMHAVGITAEQTATLGINVGGHVIDELF